MVGGYISDKGQMMHERLKDGLIYPINFGNQISVTPSLEILEPGRELPKGHHLTGSPDRRQRWLIIGLR